MNLSGTSEKTSQTLDLNRLFPVSLTASGSFDLRRMQYNSFKAVLQALSIPTLLVSRHRVIELANRAFVELVDDVDPVGLQFSSLFPEKDDLELSQLLKEVIEDRRKLAKETALAFGDKILWVRMHLRTVRLATDLMVLVEVENLTAEKELSISRKYKNLINIFPIGVAEFASTEDLARHFNRNKLLQLILDLPMVEANTEFAKMHGHQHPDKLVGLTLGQFLPDKAKGRGLLMNWLHHGSPTLSFERKEKCLTLPTTNFENTLILNTNNNAIMGIWWLKRDISVPEKNRTRNTKGSEP